MSTTGIIIVVIIVALVVGWGSWFTAKKFRNIESNETNRRKHIDEDVKVNKHE